MSFFRNLGQKPLQPGDSAPAVSGVDQDGQQIDLPALFQNGTTLLYFYPKAATTGCTAQACSLRDSFSELADRGVRVLGVSFDQASAQKRFQEKQRLPFPLLADTDKAIARAFGVPSLFSFVARQSFLIRDGKIIAHFPNSKTGDHGMEVLSALDGL